MRKLTMIGMLAGAGIFALAQTASAERVCRSVCDGGVCTQKCFENNDRTVIERDRAPKAGVDVHAPGVNVDVK